MALCFFPMPLALCPMPSSQLPAGGRNILSLALANHDRIVIVDQNLLKLQNGIFIRALILAAFVGIERDQIDFRFDRPQQPGQAPGIFSRVVDIF